MCNTTFLYQISMENFQKKKQYKNMQISKYFSGCKIFFLMVLFKFDKRT